MCVGPLSTPPTDTKIHYVKGLEHSGSYNGCHYTAYVRAGADENHFSDTHCSSATPEQVLAAQAFLLFYVREG